MKKILTKSLAIIMSIIIIFSIISGIIISINLLAKYNKERHWAETNTIKIGEQDILYVDLTREEQIKELNQPEENNQVSTNDESIVEKDYENAYNVEIKLDDNKAIVDGKEVEIKDILGNIDENASREQIYQYLSENIVGDIEYDGESIKVNNPYSTNNILVKTSNIDKINNTENIESITKISNDIYCVEYSNARETQAGYNSLKQDDAIESVLKDCIVTALENDADLINVQELSVPQNKEAWGINDTGLAKYRNMLNQRNDNPEIRVAVLDSGIRATHEVFKKQNTADRLDLELAYNYVNKNKDITDEYGHGTMVSGIIAEGTPNNVKIVPVKVLNSNGKGNLIDILKAMYTIVDKVDVINLSLGFPNTELTNEQKQFLEDAFKGIYEFGIPVICASGNEGKEDVYYPANSKYTIAVGAVNSEKKITNFSNYGDTLDFTAPGEDLILPDPTTDSYYTEEGSVHSISNKGTSFSAPFITSAIAMIKTENRNYSIQQVKNVLIENCEDLGEPGKDKYYGYGEINFNSKMYGDLNKNKEIDIGDILCLKRHIAQAEDKAVAQKHTDWKLSDGQVLVGDLNHNGKIDVGDVLIIARYNAAQNSEQVKAKHSTWLEI